MFIRVASELPEVNDDESKPKVENITLLQSKESAEPAESSCYC